MSKYLDIANEAMRGIGSCRLDELLNRINSTDQREHLRFIFNERAAICEFDGNLLRHEAERIAMDQVAAEVDLLHEQSSNSPPDKPAGASCDPSPCQNTPDTPERLKSNVWPPAVDSSGLFGGSGPRFGLPDTGKRGGA